MNAEKKVNVADSSSGPEGRARNARSGERRQAVKRVSRGCGGPPLRPLETTAAPARTRCKVRPVPDSGHPGRASGDPHLDKEGRATDGAAEVRKKKERERAARGPSVADEKSRACKGRPPPVFPGAGRSRARARADRRPRRRY